MALPTSIVLKELKTLLDKTSYVMTVTSKLSIYFFLDCDLTSTLSSTTIKLQRKYGIGSKNLWKSQRCKQERESMLYDEFDNFTSKPGESIQSYYLRYAKLINDMKMIPMSMSNMKINTKLVNHLQPEWSRFIIAAKQARYLHCVKFDQLYDFLKHNEKDVKKVREMRQQFPEPLALLANTYNPPPSYSSQQIQYQSYAGNAGNNQASGARVSNTVGNVGENQTRAVRCYNCNGEGHIAKQFTLQATTNFNADHVNAYDSDCDDEATANAIFRALLSPVGSLNDETVCYDSDILSEVPYYDTYHDSDMLNSNIQKLGYIENIVSNNESYDELTSNRNVISYTNYMLTIGNKDKNFEKNKDKNFVHVISIIDFSKDNPFSGSTNNTLPPSSSPVKTSDNLEKFADELAPLDSLPPGNDDSTLKKDFHEETFQVYSNPLFKFDDNFKSSNNNPLFEENDKDTEIKSSSSFTLTSLEDSEFEAYLERDSIPSGIDLTLPPVLKVSSSNSTSPTLTGEKVCSWKTPMFFSLIQFVWKMMTRIAIRKKIICLLATYLHQKPKLLSRPQEVEEIKEKEDEVSSDVPIYTIAMPIRITFDNLIDFNDHFSKPKDFKKDLTVSFDSSESSILPPPLLDFDSPFTAELSASVTLNSLKNEDKVFKPGILVYHTIHDNNLVTLEENLKENISSGTFLVFKEPSFLLPPPEPPDDFLNFEPNLVMKNVMLNEASYQSNVEDVNSFTIIIWIFFPYFPYTKESPLIFSFRSENFVFDPNIVTFHKPVVCSMKVFYLLSLRTTKFRDRVEFRESCRACDTVTIEQEAILFRFLVVCYLL
ncbi:hypothetical protein Tco_1548174 [Tanacetum coccineum]